MTQKESDRLTRVETNQENQKELLEKIEAKLDRNYEVMMARVEAFEKTIEKNFAAHEKNFVTRTELKLTQWFIGIAISITVLAVTVVDKIRTH
jgi:predicted transcriptional regulator